MHGNFFLQFVNALSIYTLKDVLFYPMSFSWRLIFFFFFWKVQYTVLRSYLFACLMTPLRNSSGLRAMNSLWDTLIPLPSLNLSACLSMLLFYTSLLCSEVSHLFVNPRIFSRYQFCHLCSLGSEAFANNRLMLQLLVQEGFWIITNIPMWVV